MSCALALALTRRDDDDDDESAPADATRCPRSKLCSKAPKHVARCDKARSKNEREGTAMTSEEATRLAEAEGLTLSVDPSTPCGYRGVSHLANKSQPFKAQVPGGGTVNGKRHLGCGTSPHEAALIIARALGPAESAARQCQHRNRDGWLETEASELSAQEATRLSQAEGLTLRRSRGRAEFWAVSRAQAVGLQAVSTRWRADFTVGKTYATERAARDELERAGESAVSVLGPQSSGRDQTTGRSLGGLSSSRGTCYLGQFASAAGAALAIARRLRDDTCLAARVRSLQQQQLARGGAVGPARPRKPQARAPSWLLPADRATWRDEDGGEVGGEVELGDAGVSDDDEADEEGGADEGEDEVWASGVEVVEVVEVEAWSDDGVGESSDNHAVTWVQAELLDAAGVVGLAAADRAGA